METTFFIWPPPDHGSHGATAIPPPPRAARAKKKPAGPKKLPQRGLGVEQLERLRLQEHLRKMDKSDHLSLAAPPRPGFSLFYHVAAARYPAVIPPPEFPSSQSLHCSEQCELCVRVRTENFVSLEIMPAVIVLSSFFCFSTDETAAGREGCRGRETEKGSHGRGNSFKVFLSLSPEFFFFLLYLRSVCAGRN